jgi:uncharacterized protein (TIGR00106 family)
MNRQMEEKMVIAEVTIVPIGTGTPSLSQYVAKAVSLLGQEKTVKHRLTGMGTIIEGNLTDILEVVKKMHETVFDAGVKRVVTQVRIDDRRDKESSVEYKVQSVAKKLT